MIRTTIAREHLVDDRAFCPCKLLPIMIMRNFVLLALWAPTTVFGNDGFYQGSGTDLFPVKNENLRVIQETLTLSPLEKAKCYKLNFPKSQYIDGVLKDGAMDGSVGEESNCDSKDSESVWPVDDRLQVKWHAKAVYEIESLENQKDVQMGFPIPEWEYTWAGSDGLFGTKVPGATNFKVFVDGREIKKVSKKNVEVPRSQGGKGKRMAPAFVWELDFLKGRKYTLISEYDFGVEWSIGHYHGRELPNGTKAWYNRSKKHDTLFQAESLIYYLHPLALWNSKPPLKIDVRIVVPKGLSSFSLLPNTKSSYCLDHDSLWLKWRDRLPEGDLRVAYPAKPAERAAYPQSKEEFEAWRKLMTQLQDSKTKTEFACSLTKTFPAMKDFNRLSNPCVDHCSQ